MKIEVVGPGCARCITTEKNVRQALQQLGINAEVVKVTDVAEFAKKGVMFTPGVIVDGEVKFAGRVPNLEEIKKILVDKGKK
jgi:small redox-active disulfide protein 2